ncbi:MAG: class I SAM-dependent methyltransferase [Melioribacteraceae bacterium]
MANPKYWEREIKIEPDEVFSSKVKRLLETLPKDIKTIADVGCGNGKITNELGKYFDVVGIDRSTQALKSVQTKKLQCSADDIKLGDNSIDLVFSSELLEHLEDQLLADTISELKRISKKYIYVTVPNNESIKKNFVECIHCETIFNKTYHLRSFSIEKFGELFPGYKILNHFTFGSKVREYNQTLEKVKHKYANPNSWIPPKWTSKGHRKTVCPKCSKEFEIPYKFNLISFICDKTNILISPKKNWQLFVIMEKK